jgi:hypothetical protein
MIDKEYLTKLKQLHFLMDCGFWWNEKPKVYIPSPSGKKFGKFVYSNVYGVYLDKTEIGEIPKNEFNFSALREVIENHLIHLRLEKINILLND